MIAGRQREPRLHAVPELSVSLLGGREQRVKDRLPQRGLAQFVRPLDHHQRLRQIPGLVGETAERMQCDRLQPHARVTLTFEHEAARWTLEKRWGAGRMSRLSDGTTAIADPEAVHGRLGEMLVHGEATFRHVLFTGQAELERTFLTIREQEQAGELRDIGDLLQAAVDSSADVDEMALRRKLAEQVEAAFGRWDDANGRPERQNGKEKGLSDPWKRDIGDILRAWYAWKTLLAERDRILDLERQLDDVSAQVAA